MGTRARQRLRLAGYDYRRPGAYFVTVVTWHRQRIFGGVRGGKMILSQEGEAVSTAWISIPEHCPGVMLDAFVVMPDHVHGVLLLEGSELDLCQVVNLFKGGATRAINRARGTPGAPVWQSRFHDWIVRDDGHLENIRRYIEDNPRNWDLDIEGRGLKH